MQTRSRRTGADGRAGAPAVAGAADTGDGNLKDVTALDAALNEIDVFVESACREIDRKADAAAAKMRTLMSMAMIRIPLNQREMKMEEWMAMGNGDIFEVIKRMNEERVDLMEADAPGTVAGMAATGMRTTRRRGRNAEDAPDATVVRPRTRMRADAQAFATPAPSRAGPSAAPAAAAIVPGTASRLPQMGEVVYSAQGSPLGIHQGGAIVTPAPGTVLPSAVTRRARPTVNIKLTSASQESRTRSRTKRARVAKGGNRVPETVEEGEEGEEEEAIAVEIDGAKFHVDKSGIRPEGGSDAIKLAPSLFETLKNIVGTAVGSLAGLGR